MENRRQKNGGMSKKVKIEKFVTYLLLTKNGRIIMKIFSLIMIGMNMKAMKKS